MNGRAYLKSIGTWLLTYHTFLSLQVPLSLGLSQAPLVGQQHLPAVLQMGLRLPGVLIRRVVLPSHPVKDLPLQRQKGKGHSVTPATSLTKPLQFDNKDSVCGCAYS